jgi:hypothetical protein
VVKFLVLHRVFFLNEQYSSFTQLLDHSTVDQLLTAPADYTTVCDFLLHLPTKPSISSQVVAAAAAAVIIIIRDQ